MKQNSKVPNRALYDFVDPPEGVPEGSVVVRDVGHDRGFPTVTNDAEQVVETLLRLMARLGDPPGTRIFYYDSEGTLSELRHDGERYAGIANVLQG